MRAQGQLAEAELRYDCVRDGKVRCRVVVDAERWTDPSGRRCPVVRIRGGDVSRSTASSLRAAATTPAGRSRIGRRLRPSSLRGDAVYSVPAAVDIAEDVDQPRETCAMLLSHSRPPFRVDQSDDCDAEHIYRPVTQYGSVSQPRQVVRRDVAAAMVGTIQPVALVTAVRHAAGFDVPNLTPEPRRHR